MSFSTNATPPSPIVDILLATYNGGSFLQEQLQSLQSQSIKDWRLWIKDDGSTDNTLEIIEEACSDPRINTLSIKEKHQGASMSFSCLMENTPKSAAYVMFCDQDDIWHPDKIELSLQRIRDLETAYGNVPILVHSDLNVVNENKQLISSSFWRYQGLNPKKNKTKDYLIQNNVTGCTVIINKALKDLSMPIPVNAVMHDWWLALVASTFGIVDFIDKQLIDYRQHSSNEVGAKKYSFKYILLRSKDFISNERITHFKDSLLKTQVQAKLLYERFDNKLTNTQKEQILSYADIMMLPRLQRLVFFGKNKIFKQGIARTIGFLLTVFVTSRD